MSDFFSSYIFRKLNCSKDEEIALDRVKQVIMAGGEEAELF